MFGLGFLEILVILALLLIVVGPDRLPELARSLGKMTGQLRRTADEFKSELRFSSLDFDKNIRDELAELRRMTWEDVDDDRSEPTENLPCPEDSNTPEGSNKTEEPE